MDKPTNADRLRELMDLHRLKPADVATMLDRSYQTVRIWLSVSDQNIPDPLLELLEYKLAEAING